MAKEPKHIVKFKELHLKQSEKVIAWSEGYIGNAMGNGSDRQHNGVLLVTPDRVVFYRKGIMGEVIESVPLKNINSLERQSGLMKHTIFIYSSGNKIEFKSVNKADNEKLVSEIEKAQEGAGSISAKPAANVEPTEPKEDVYEQLKKLGELKELGILSEQEFTEKKAILMSRI
ncbi:PH domain-containing protein [Pseudoalteromonas agarivorans]|uniref:PH domain-containing protein n=1 Tax=Pseudoalteromonas agarivorans TaxID=176102 RepID=UPI00249A9419|nr:PH domain-containing protein [Pseudoalteromonas agarivorans]MDI3246836.1 PH domain-containing protein [Pseudoalteromonas agarivorans]